jgi:Methyltransferase FkbM domain
VADTRYAVHHLGGRWGDGPFPRLAAFSGDFVHVLYEADIDGLPAPAETAENTTIVAACLAGQRGPRTLNLTFNPGGTSLLDPADNVRGLYRPTLGIDFDLDRGLDVIGQRQLDADTLDAVIAAGNIPAPDFLSLDTQGTEFEILAAAPGALASACGLIVEVEFIEMYRGQKRFQEVLDLLDGAGFAFVRFTRMGELSGPRRPLGLRGRGRQIWADALFLRRPDEGPVSAGRLLKLAFTALVFGHIEFALAWLDQVLPDDPEFAASDRGYAALLREVKREATGGPMPPILSQVLPRDRIQSFSTTPPAAWAELFELASFRDDPSYLAQLEALACADATPFERVLRSYGLEEVAAEVADTRRAQAREVHDTLTRSQARARSA